MSQTSPESRNVQAPEAALRERHKELRCLYGISVLLETPAGSFDEIAKKIVELIPPAFQFPEVAAARIVLEGRSFPTTDFRETPAMLVSDVVVSGVTVGEVAVAYLEARPPGDEGPFLADERRLLAAIAENLGRCFGHFMIVAAVRQSEERYRAVVESSRELIFFLDPGGRLRWHNPAFRELIGAVSADEELFRRVHPGDAPRVADAWRSAQGEGRGTVSYRLQTADGGYRTLESRFRKTAVADEILWCVSSTDTTELTKLRRKVAEHEGISGIVGRDPKILQISASIMDLAEADAPVLILGESGTGKELVATAIHREGPRATKNFIAINCGAIPETLLETELFGHVKGSFTGAIRDKKGRFELADGGTIFFDEVGDLSPAMQVKLLRVLQEGTFEKVGAEKPCRVDVRLISATNKDLQLEVAAKRFREDLFYRISVVPLTIPPLRERLTDIPLLAEHLVDEETRRSERRRDPTRPPLKVTIAGEALALLLAHSWPGNIRELQNVLRFALIKCKGNLLRPEHLPSAFTTTAHSSLSIKGRKPKLTADMAASALERAGGHPGEAARSLGVSRTTLYRHLAKTR